ncbi:MAG: ArsA family ATPase, partial [Candidatus Omnitrophica bacterium]|nr:ArsA family ATPase [Candidatus Omnitrophota bacterium]
MNLPSPAFLTRHELRLVLFGGKGGVGKTSCATATALHWAEKNPTTPILLVSTDPAHSISDSLAGAVPPSNLTVLELDAQACMAEFQLQHRLKFQEIASRGTFLDATDIDQVLNLSLPGLDELMAFLEICRWTEVHQYQTIFVDTAPSGHTLRLLGMPVIMRQWLGALNALLAKHRYLKRLYCGTYQPDEIDQFLVKLAASVDQMDALLRNPACCQFVPVVLAEEMCFRETVALLEELRRAGVPITDLVVNRLLPANRCPVCATGRLRQSRELNKLRDAQELFSGPIWGLPLYPDEVCGIEPLRRFWKGLVDLTPRSIAPPRPAHFPRPMIEAPAKPPASDLAMVILAGKGGVGKTTLACSTALRMVDDFPGREVLLFSTDPAHSLSACLKLPIGPTPKRVVDGLTAVEIDAQSEFASLKRLYSRELAAFFKSLLPEMDLAYDREAMENFLDLAPPGLDEVMALTHLMDLLDQGQFQSFVLDSAPTGHLIRFLEMPGLINHWLKVYFGLALKYKHLFRTPKVTQRLVKISKALKSFRTLISNPVQCSLYAVSILTSMAFHETKDLIDACQRIGIDVPILFL